jgi:hypothetical protein
MTSSLYELFKTSEDYEKDGVVIDLGVAKFRLRRSGGSNRKFATVFAKKVKPHQRALTAGTLPEEESRRMLLEVFYETVVVGWEGVTDEAGQPLEFNEANFKKLMTDLPDLWDLIREEANNAKNFRREDAVAQGEELGKS